MNSKTTLKVVILKIVMFNVGPKLSYFSLKCKPLVLYIPRYNTDMCPPSASSQQNACQDRAGILWVSQQCSVVSQMSQEDTGHILGGQKSQRLCAGTLEAQLVAERPRKKKL